MKQSDDAVLKLLDAMFPGEPGRNVPCFSASGAFEVFRQRFGDLDAIVGLLPADALTFATALEDINSLLKQMKAAGGESVERFIDQAMIAYFSAPSVSIPLTGKPSPLFPNATVMKEIDFALLEPVLENIRGIPS